MFSFLCFNVTELQKTLIQFYKERTSTIAFSPFHEVGRCSLADLYVPPNIFRKSQKKAFGMQTNPKQQAHTAENSKYYCSNVLYSNAYNKPLEPDKYLDKPNTSYENDSEFNSQQVTTYQDIFNDAHNRYVFICGEPGAGKSTFCTMLSLDWCRVKSGTPKETLYFDEFSDLSSLEQFEFVFLIWLKLTKADSLIDILITFVEPLLGIEYKPLSRFIRELLCQEPCLIIYDGLDELTTQNFGTFGGTLPLDAMANRSTILAMTRPWKLDELSKCDPLPDKVFEMQGVDADKQVEKMYSLVTADFKQLNEFWLCYNKHPEFHNNPLLTAAIFYSNLSILYINIVYMHSDASHLQDNEMLTNSTHWQANSDILKNCTHLQENFEILLGKLAFETLFPNKIHPKYLCLSERFLSLYFS